MEIIFNSVRRGWKHGSVPFRVWLYGIGSIVPAPLWHSLTLSGSWWGGSCTPGCFWGSFCPSQGFFFSNVVMEMAALSLSICKTQHSVGGVIITISFHLKLLKHIFNSFKFTKYQIILGMSSSQCIKRQWMHPHCQERVPPPTAVLQNTTFVSERLIFHVGISTMQIRLYIAVFYIERSGTQLQIFILSVLSDMKLWSFSKCHCWKQKAKLIFFFTV